MNNTLTLSPATRHALFWIGIFALFLVLIQTLGQILLPFVVGGIIAYFLNPVCNILARNGMSRSSAAMVAIGIFILTVANLLLIAGPVISNQIAHFVQQIPDYVAHFRSEIEPKLQAMIGSISGDELTLTRAREISSQYAGEAASIIAGLLGKIWQGSTAIVNIISLVFIMPIVAFYLMRDWEKLISTIENALPRAHAETIRTEIKKVDTTLAGFVRGQATVCIILGIYYAAVLSVFGVNFSLVIGLIGAVLSFIPFVGSAFVLISSVAISFFQFDGLTVPASVGAAILVGQFIEGNFLTPKLVGESVGLHPLWIIFALMAGGGLFGFIGLLLAVPLAAVCGVLIRFALSRYLASSYYNATTRPRRTRAIKPI